VHHEFHADLRIVAVHHEDLDLQRVWNPGLKKMSHLRFDPAFTRREQRWGVCVAALLWVVSMSVLVMLVAWSAKAAL
jgi:hypothetical protein